MAIKFKPITFQILENDEGPLKAGDLIASEHIGTKTAVYPISKTANDKFVLLHKGYYDVWHDTADDAIKLAQEVHQQVMNELFNNHIKELADVVHNIKSIDFKDLEFASYSPIQEPGAEPSGADIYLARQNLPNNRQITYYISSVTKNGKFTLMIIDTAYCYPIKYEMNSVEDAKEKANQLNSEVLMECYNGIEASFKFIHQFFKED